MVFLRHFWQGNHHTYIRSYAVKVYGSGQPYAPDMCLELAWPHLFSVHTQPIGWGLKPTHDVSDVGNSCADRQKPHGGNGLLRNKKKGALFDYA